MRLEPLAMNVLVYLLEHANQVVSTTTLLERFWSGRHADPGMVARCVRQIRGALGDDARSPRYVETIRKRGYRAVAVAIAEGEAPARQASDDRSDAAMSIGVMPFDDLSPNGDQGWLARGIGEELIEFLWRIPGLRVPASSSALMLKRQGADLETIARRLDVVTILEGSVQRVGDRITVLVHWTRIADHARLWSARFERRLEDVLAVQKAIAIAIAEGLRAELGVQDSAVFLAEYRYQTSNVQAWEYFRKGFDLAFTFLPDRMAEGRALLERALDLDPDYLAARVLLAWSDFDHPDHRVQVARKALARDPANVIAYRILINDSMAQWDFATARQLWERAADRKPQDNSLALVGYHVFSSLGELEKTLEVTRRGVRLDPLWNTHHYFLALAHLNLGQPRAAIEPLQTAIALYPHTGLKGIGLSQFYVALSMAHHLEGDDAAALDAAVEGHARYEREIRSGWSKGRWAGMNAALAAAFEAEEGPAWSRNIREHLAAQSLARAGAREPMYGYLQRLMGRATTNTARDRQAYRDVCFLTQALSADVDFQPYWNERRFRDLKRALDARLEASGGSCAYLA